MPNSNFKSRALVRELTISICALVMIVAGTAAHASSHWRLRPHISGMPSTTDVAGQPYSFTPTGSGPSGYTLTYAISGKPSWASFSASTGTLSGTPTTANIGTFSNIVISVSDGVARASLASFTITVSAPATAAPPPPPNTAPTISGAAPAAATVGTAYSFAPSASDTDGDTLSFSVQNKPAWAAFSIATGALSGTPSTTDVGTDSNIVISVSDGYTSVALAPFSINVTQPTTPPATSGTATLTWTPPVSNTDGSALTDLAGYHIYYGTSPSTLSTVIDVGSPGTLTYTVNNLSSGTWYFSVAAYTTTGLESSPSNTGSKSVP